MNSPVIKTTAPQTETPESATAQLLRRLQSQQLNWNDIWVWFARLMALVAMLRGFADWGIICGFIASPSGSFETEPLASILITVLNAIVQLFAATGLWMLSSWGVVLWLLSMFLLIFIDLGHFFGLLTMAPELGRDMLTTASDIALVLIYFIITAKATQKGLRT